jgi:hypothetical protein
MYETILTIAFRHEYYSNGNCPVLLSPTVATVRLLARHDILFRKQNSNRWLLVSQNPLAELEDNLQFNITAGEAVLYYVTREWKTNPAITVEAANASKVWQTVTINIPYLIENKIKEVYIETASEEKFLEYLCIPKFNAADMALRLTEEKDRLPITEAFEPVTLPDGTLARQFVTGEKIKLHQDNGITMQLWEKRDSGERLIAGAIESPDPGQASPFSPKDTITRIFYY